MNIIVLTPVRILGDGIASGFSSRLEKSHVQVVGDLETLRVALTDFEPNIVLIDVTQDVEFIDFRAIAVQWPDIPLIALGLTEILQEVIKCGRAGFAGYIARDVTIDGLCQAITELANGRLACPPEISGGLLRSLFRVGPQTEESLASPTLTRREREVLAMLGRGLTNKEIGKELCLSVATVKHHVHHLLEKLGLKRRADAMRRVQDAPWLASATSSQKKY